MIELCHLDVVRQSELFGIRHGRSTTSDRGLTSHVAPDGFQTQRISPIGTPLIQLTEEGAHCGGGGDGQLPVGTLGGERESVLSNG